VYNIKTPKNLEDGHKEQKFMVLKLEKYNKSYLNELFCSYYIQIYNDFPMPNNLPKDLLILNIKRLIKIKIEKENSSLLTKKYNKA